MKDWHKLSFLEIANLFRTNQLSPVELVKEIYLRINNLEPHLNAFITLTEEAAVKSAKKAEEIFQKGEPASILCGIPYNVKDIFETEGIKTTCGSRILKNYFPTKTAKIVQFLQDQGAVLIGKTNLLEFAYGIVHPDYGQTNNPYNYDKTAGGSSGGSAASIAAGLGFFSLGTDTGGSIRIPASYCGIAGLKPTYGLLNVEGIFPLSQSLDHAGPMAKSVEEIRVLMELLTNSVSQHSDHNRPTIGVLPDSYLADDDPEVLAVYQTALQYMKQIGWKMKSVHLEHFYRTEEILMNVLLPEAALIHEKWLGQKEEYAPLTYKQLEMGVHHLSMDYLRAKNEMPKVKESIDAVLEEVDFLFMPTVPYPAPNEDPALESDNEMKYTGLFNLSGHPAISFQGGFSKNGLPIGLHMVAKHYDEDSLLQTASMLEKRLHS